jgi:ParB-like chromosome segregation protein Spo0J
MKDDPSRKSPLSDGVVMEQTYEMVDVNEVKLHPQNPNEGDLGAIMESISANGFWGALIVQASTMFVLAGNHRLMAARELGISSVPAVIVDVDDEQALRVLAADNRTARLGLDDQDALTQLLTMLAMTDSGLAGTGYDGDDLDAMLAEQNEFKEPSKSKKSSQSFKVVVTCETAEDQADVLQRLLGMGLDAKAR